MQQPSDDANVRPSAQAKPNLSLSVQAPSDATLAAAPDLTIPVDTSTETPTLAVPAAESRVSLAAAESRVSLAAVGDRADTLNLAERLVAELGAWASMLAERWTPSLGPFFTSDGRTAVDSCDILSALDSELSATAR